VSAAFHALVVTARELRGLVRRARQQREELFEQLHVELQRRRQQPE
jgi:hypothetical protein